MQKGHLSLEKIRVALGVGRQEGREEDGRKERTVKKEGSREGSGTFVERLLYAKTAVSGPHYLAIHFSQAACEADTTDPIFRDWPVLAGGGAGI